MAAVFDEPGKQPVRNSSKGRPSRKKLVSLMVMASAMERSRSGFFLIFKCWTSSSRGHAVVAQELGEARLEEVIARRVKHVLREAKTSWRRKP